jgi:hypothetical protein
LSDRLTIDIFGILHGSADGPLAIAALMLVVVLVTKRLWWPRRHRPIVFHPSRDEGVPEFFERRRLPRKAPAMRAGRESVVQDSAGWLIDLDRPPHPLRLEKASNARVRLLRLEPPLENLRLLVDPPHDLGGGAADQPSRRRHGFGRQRRDLARGFQGLGLDFTCRDAEPYHITCVGVFE